MEANKTSINWGPQDNGDYDAVDKTEVNQESESIDVVSEVELNDDTEIKGIRWGRLKFKLKDKSFNTVEFAVSYNYLR